MEQSQTTVSRRRLLKSLPQLLAFSASQALADTGLRIDRIKVYVAPVLPESQFGTSRFKSDEDPARWRWRGPFSQLAGAIFVEIGTKQGVTGFGMGGGGAAARLIIEKHLSGLLLSTDPLRVELLWDQMYSSSLFYGRRGVTIMALSGIDLALWDIIGKHYGKPVYKLLGGPIKTRVAAYYTGFNVENALGLGFQSFKIPVRNGPADGRDGMKKTVAELEKVREKIGLDRDLMIDVTCGWDLPYALEMLNRLAPLRLAFIEEPISPDDVFGYAELCRAAERLGTRIASGEHEYTRYGYRLLLHHKAIHILQPDLTWCGGLTETRRVAAMAAGENLPVVPHRGGSFYGLNFILATPNCALAESFGIGEPQSEIQAALTPGFKQGYYLAPDGPGFGTALTSALLEKASNRS